MSVVWLAAVVTAMFFGFCAGRISLGEGGTEEIVPETGAAVPGQERRTDAVPERRTAAAQERRADAVPERRTAAVQDRSGTGRDRRTKGYCRGNERIEILRGRDHQSEQRRCGGGIGSPVSGQVEDMLRDGGRSVVIRPEEDRLYAPAGGKILKLFPLGNAFLFRTELGVELYIQAGEGKDELLGRYYRPRVVRNEIVGKGKLLLEFDRQGLEAEGVSPVVTVTVESGMYGSNIMAVAGEYVRTGEEILSIQRQQG